MATCIAGAGVLTYGYLALVARNVPSGEYGGFGAFWSLALIVGFGAFLPVELELARALSSDPSSGLPPHTRRTLGWLALGCLAVVALGSPLLVPALGGVDSLVPLVALVAVSAGQFLLRGLLLGRGRLVVHGTVLLGDSALRVVLAGAVGILLPTAGSATYCWTTVAAAAIAHLPLLARSVRGPRSLLAPAASPAGPAAAPPGTVHGMSSVVAHLLVGTVSAQVLLNASPVLVSAVASDSEARTAAAYVACFTLVRLPLFVAVPLQSALVPMLVSASRGGSRAVRAVVLRVLICTAVLAGVGWALGGLVGPELVGLLFGDRYRLSGAVVGILAGGAGLHVGLLVLSQVLVAQQLHRRVAVVWLSGVATGLVVFLAVPDLVLRATLAFAAGTAVALSVSTALLVAGVARGTVPEPPAPSSTG